MGGKIMPFKNERNATSASKTYLQNQIFCEQIIGHFSIHYKSQSWRHLQLKV